MQTRSKAHTVQNGASQEQTVCVSKTEKAPYTSAGHRWVISFV